MTSIQGIYIALYGRPADPAGLAYYTDVTNNGEDLSSIGDLSSVPEYQDRFADMSSEEIVTSIYESLFERAPDAEGLAFYVSLLEESSANINRIAIDILNGAQNEDLATINAKIEAADLFTMHLDTDAEVAAYQGNDAAQIGREFIDTVDADDEGTGDEADAFILMLFPDEGQAPGEEPGQGGGGGGGNGGGGPTYTVSELLQLTIIPDAYNLKLQAGGEYVGDLTVSDAEQVPDIIADATNAAAYNSNGYSYDITDTLAAVQGAYPAALNLAASVTAEGSSGTDAADFSAVTQDLIIFGNGGADSIVAGQGDDLIDGGNGQDLINLTSGGTDTVVLATAGSSRDIITGFNGDHIELSDAATTADLSSGVQSAQVGMITATPISAADIADPRFDLQLGTTPDDVMVIFENDFSDSFSDPVTSGDLFDALRDDTFIFGHRISSNSVDEIAVGTDGWKGYLVAYADNDAYVFYANDESGNGLLVKSEVSLVGTLDGFGSSGLSAADFIA